MRKVSNFALPAVALAKAGLPCPSPKAKAEGDRSFSEGGAVHQSYAGQLFSPLVELSIEALTKLNPGKTIKMSAMEEGKRQKQIAGLLNEEMNQIFQKLGLSMLDGGMVSISSVKVTPDLLEARIYLSFFQVRDVKKALHRIEEKHHEIKKELASRIRHQLRNVPVLKFFQDDTLEQVFKLEELFKKIESEKSPKNKDE